MSDRYPRVLKDSVEIWLNDPITKTYLKSLEFYLEQLQETRQQGGFVNDTSNDLTLRRLFQNLGAEQAIRHASEPMQMLSNYELLKELNDD